LNLIIIFISLVFVQTASETTASLLTLQEQSIITLVKGAKSVHVFQKGETIQAGCALIKVNDDINVLLMVKVKKKNNPQRTHKYISKN